MYPALEVLEVRFELQPVVPNDPSVPQRKPLYLFPEKVEPFPITNFFQRKLKMMHSQLTDFFKIQNSQTYLFVIISKQELIFEFE